MDCARNRELGAMSESPQRFAARKQLLLAQAQLERMQLSLYVNDARDALRPAGVIGSAVARPAAFVALADTVARILGWRRLSSALRVGAIAVAAYRIARAWRGSTR
jgi:hypothetical protein